MTPEAALQRALREAARADGRSFPNPPVGAVVFRGDRVLGVGHTRPAGGPHAEIVALAQAARRHGARALRGASLAVTLEPCNHQGRTGPCSEAIVAAGVARVYAGHADPDGAASGGAARLRRAGVAVEFGVLEAECRFQHRGFLSVLERGRPWLELKLAATLDGRIASARGESRWITGPASRALVHRLRDHADAVMVGSGTARVDDPELNVRRGERVLRTPIRVVVDAGLTLSPRAKLLSGAEAVRTWMLAGTAVSARRREACAAHGARVLETPRRDGHLDLRRALARLAREGVTRVLVEGGAGLAAALLRAELVDELHWFIAPSLLGGDARPALGPLGLSKLAARVVPRCVQVRRVGEDLYVHALLVPGGRRARGDRA